MYRSEKDEDDDKMLSSCRLEMTFEAAVINPLEMNLVESYFKLMLTEYKC